MRRRAALAALAALGLAGAAGANGPATYTVVLRGGRIEPARLEVPAGQRIKFVVRNEEIGRAHV